MSSGQMRVCWKCFSDEDLIERIKVEGWPKGCDFCGRRDALTADFDSLGEFIAERFCAFYGSADDLPYESAEGGYQGVTYSSWDLVFRHLDLPRDSSGDLFRSIEGAIGDQLWTDYDWLSLDEDVLYGYNWKKFCETIKHERRFFFQKHNHDEEDRESISPIDLLGLLWRWIQEWGLITNVPVDETFHRARKSKPTAPLRTPAEFGPPPRQFALQANRMNPAGIPMMYCAERRMTAIAETPGATLSVGRFRSLRQLTVVDFTRLPEIPGFFSSASRQEVLVAKFLWKFREDIELPVARADGAHIDYLPSQVVTEYLRSLAGEEAIHGVRYRSIKIPGEANVVFFAEQGNIKGAVTPDPWGTEDYWFEMTSKVTLKRPKGL